MKNDSMVGTKHNRYWSITLQVISKTINIGYNSTFKYSSSKFTWNYNNAGLNDEKIVKFPSHKLEIMLTNLV